LGSGPLGANHNCIAVNKFISMCTATVLYIFASDFYFKIRETKISDHDSSRFTSGYTNLKVLILDY